MTKTSGRERTAQTLGGSPRRFRNAIETLPDPFAIHSAIRDETGRIVDFAIDYVNTATTKFNGLSAEQQTGRRLLELFPAMPDDGLFDAFVRVVETGEPFERESVVYEDPNAAGGPIQSVLHIRAVKFGDGYIVSSRDLTTHARAEAALRTSQDRYRTLAEQSSDAIFVLDADGRVVEANVASQQLLGCAQGALQGRRWEELIAPDDLAAHPLHFTELRAGATLRFERQMRHADGAIIPVELSAKMLPDGRFLEIGRDISERRAAEESLRQAAQLFELIYESVADVVYLLAVEPGGVYRFESVNRAFLTATGMAREQVVGRRIEDVLPASSHALVLGNYRRAIEERRRVNWEEAAIYPAGTKVGEVNVVPTFDDTGRCTHLIGAVHDVTERKLLEERLHQSERLEAVGQLAGGMAHDFNNLLTAIRGYAEMLRGNLPSDDEPNRADIDQVISAADRAATLTRQLLAFSRRQVLQPKVIDPAEVVQGVVPMLRRLLGEHIELNTHTAPGLGCVKVDPSQLEQVIVNLAVNAGDAMPDGGKLTVELSSVVLGPGYAAAHPEVSPGPYVMLAVSDTGIGMDAETQAHIFEPFFTTKELGSGTGMGLATVYGIVKQSGGSIYVYSEPGHGTTFRIYLPRVSEEPTAVSETSAVRPSSFGTETILLVEDEPAVRGFARRTLESHGYTVLEAAGGADALSIVASHGGPIALLLTDVVMPGMQGHQLASELTAALPELRVLYVSGFTENTVIHHGVPEHGVAFLPKPFSADALVEAVRRLLDAQSG
jgi:PAS domain S-box-containing protein